MDRLEASFGAEPIAELLVQFRSTLVDGLDALDRAEAIPIAHRVAGVAGTLGFAATGRAWLALSLGDRSVEKEVRRLSLAAITLIDGRQNAPSPSTSV